jgi:hypothetical protein
MKRFLRSLAQTLILIVGITFLLFTLSYFLGYDKGEDGRLVVNREQAKIVRRIFGDFLAGHTPFQITKALTAEGIPTPAGKTKWSYTTVRRVLSNETYMGDKLLQKTYSIDFLSKDRLKNHREVPQFYVEQDHDAIIPPTTFKRVQDELERRKGCHATGKSIFSGKYTAANVERFTAPRSGTPRINIGALFGNVTEISPSRNDARPLCWILKWCSSCLLRHTIS